MKSNLTTYINFRGDLTCKKVPFNEVDMAIFSSLAYINFKDISTQLPICLSNAIEILKQSQTYENDRKIYYDNYENLELLANTTRYKDIKIVQLSDIKEEDTTTQFSAITFLLPDSTLVVSYRGTDDSVIGWHEDFNMYLDEPIGARDKAVEYLNKTAQIKIQKDWYSFNKKLPIIILGHSKGGNLALAASLYSTELHSRIKKVYNFDGPGLPKRDLNRVGYTEIMKKTITIIPSYSFFGRLFNHGEDIKVVASCNQGLDQHNINSWLVGPNGFINDKLDKQGTDFFNKSDDFVNNLGPVHTKEFIEALFSLINFLNIQVMSELKDVELNQYIDAFFNLKSITMKEKLEIIKFIQLMSSEMKHSKNLIQLYSQINRDFKIKSRI